MSYSLVNMVHVFSDLSGCSCFGVWVNFSDYVLVFLWGKALNVFYYWQSVCSMIIVPISGIMQSLLKERIILTVDSCFVKLINFAFFIYLTKRLLFINHLSGISIMLFFSVQRLEILLLCSRILFGRRDISSLRMTTLVSGNEISPSSIRDVCQVLSEELCHV